MDVIADKIQVQQYLFRLSGLGDDNDDSVSGMMLNPMNFNGGNQFSISGEMVRQGDGGLMGIGDRLKAGFNDVLNNKFVGRQLGGYGKFNQSETRSKWTDSAKPQIVCEFTMLANSAADAQKNMKAVQLIKSAVLPIYDNGALLAPLGYKGQANADGTLTFSLGTWLLIPKLLMVSENCSPSLQVMSNGYPLFWNCTFTLEPYESITISDFNRYFQQPAVLAQGAITSSAGSGTSLTDQIQKNSLPGVGNGFGSTGIA